MSEVGEGNERKVGASTTEVKVGESVKEVIINPKPQNVEGEFGDGYRVYTLSHKDLVDSNKQTQGAIVINETPISVDPEAEGILGWDPTPFYKENIQEFEDALSVATGEKSGGLMYTEEELNSLPEGFSVTTKNIPVVKIGGRVYFTRSYLSASVARFIPDISNIGKTYGKKGEKAFKDLKYPEPAQG